MAVYTNPELWTIQEVGKYLEANNLGLFKSLLCDENKIDGKVLLGLSEEDLRVPPLDIKTLGDQKRLWFLIEHLREEKQKMDQSLFKEAYLNLKIDVESDQTSARSGISTPSSIIPLSEDEEDIIDSKRLQVEPMKFALSILYIFFAHFTASYSITYAQEHLPDPKSYPPLPDFLLDSLPTVPLAYKVTEGVIFFLAICGLLMLFFHKYRFLVIQRLLALTGTVYILRSLCVMSTAVPMPQYNYDCRPLKFESGWERLSYVIKLYAAFGLKSNGTKTCGDYVYSGHTAIITLLVLSINEYTPRHWTILHVFNWVVGFLGIFFILLGRGHYTLDVLLGFAIASKLFSIHHTFAYNANAMRLDTFRTKQCFPILYFFEKGNRGRYPSEYEWPVKRLAKIGSVVSGIKSKFL